MDAISSPPDSKESSDGLSLRLFDIADVDHLMVWASDEKVARFCTWEPYTDKELGLKFITDTAIPHPWFRAICLNDRPVGAISVTKNSGNDACRGELGYLLATQYWGKGIVTRAVKMVIDTIFVERPEMERLEALVDVENVGSQRVLEKVGFKKEGALRKYFIRKGKIRDMVMYSLLSSDILV